MAQGTEGEFAYSIEIGQGLGIIKFGLSTEEVQRYVGLPDETEILDPGAESTLMWYYESHKLQIIFQKPVRRESMLGRDPRRVIQLTTSHPAATIWGRKIIGRMEAEVLALFQQRGYEGFVVCDEPVGDVVYRSFRMEDLRFRLDFRGGLLQRVLWGSLTLALLKTVQ